MTLADVHNRWAKFTNNSTLFTTGTDEHGLKVQNAAEAANVNPKIFCNDLAQKFKDLAQLGNIKYDRFIRTTDSDHYEAVNHFWNVVNSKGWIYKGQHSGWYSISDEAFYTEMDIEESVDEKNGEKIMISKETGSKVVFQSEENYFFKLSAFQQELLTIIKSNPNFIRPQKYYDFIVNDLEKVQLSDLSISRPSWRLQWGIPVPGDESQKIYVWFDALVNYITCTGYPKTTAEQLPKMTHLIGKDIIKFHCIHWPTFLMAAGLPLPKQIFVHGHWLMGGRKMSKSRGNVADPVQISQIYDTDALRLFLMRDSVLDSDGDYSEERLNALRSEFIDKFCNLLLRSLSKNFSIERALCRLEASSYQSLLDQIPDNKFKSDLLQVKESINDLFEEMNPTITQFNMHKALQSLFARGPLINSLFDKYEPWTLKVKKEDEPQLAATKQLKQDLIIYTALDSLRVILILLQSFIPTYSNMLLDRLKVLPNCRTVEFAKFGADISYGVGSTFKKGEQVPLKKVEFKQE